MGSLFRVTTSMLLYGQTCMNVFHVKTLVDDIDTGVNTVAAKVSADWVGIIRPMVIQSVRFTNIKVQNLSFGPNGPVLNQPLALDGLAGAEAQCALNSNWVLKLETGLSGRKTRGRLYIPGLQPGHMVLGVLSTNALNVWSNTIGQLNAAWTDTGVNDHIMVIHGRNDNPLDFFRVSNISLKGAPGAQRRRMVGVGI